MSGLSWQREHAPVWDEDKVRIIGGAPEGAFVLPFQPGEALPGDWFSARDESGRIVGFGRLDTTWGGDAEILLAVDPACQERGIGGFILARLEDEAAQREINYIHNRIREHDRRDLVHDWLVVRGFRGSVDGDLRKRVHSQDPAPAPRPAHPVEAYDAAGDPGSRPPGHEESGGYVNVDEHQY